MGTPRNIDHPRVKTYIVPSKTADGIPIHVRLYSTKYHLDKRGTGRTLAEAIKDARRGVPKASRKTNRKKTSRRH